MKSKIIFSISFVVILMTMLFSSLAYVDPTEYPNGTVGSSPTNKPVAEEYENKPNRFFTYKPSDEPIEGGGATPEKIETASKKLFKKYGWNIDDGAFQYETASNKSTFSASQWKSITKFSKSIGLKGTMQQGKSDIYFCEEWVSLDGYDKGYFLTYTVIVDSNENILGACIVLRSDDTVGKKWVASLKTKEPTFIKTMNNYYGK